MLVHEFMGLGCKTYVAYRATEGTWLRSKNCPRASSRYVLFSFVLLFPIPVTGPNFGGALTSNDRLRFRFWPPRGFTYLMYQALDQALDQALALGHFKLGRSGTLQVVTWINVRLLLGSRYSNKQHRWIR